MRKVYAIVCKFGCMLASNLRTFLQVWLKTCATFSLTYKRLRTVFEKNQRNLQKFASSRRKLSAKLAKVCVNMTQFSAKLTNVCVNFSAKLAKACITQVLAELAKVSVNCQPNLQIFAQSLRNLLQVLVQVCVKFTQFFAHRGNILR